MWHTESGDRILQGAEGELFRVAVARLFSWLEEYERNEEALETTVEVFDRLVFGQKLAMLDRVATALLTADIGAPELDAVGEGTIGAIYDFLSQQVTVEIDDGWVELRPLILAAARERKLDEKEEDEDEESLPEEICSDYEAWNDLIEALSMEVLWDTDWALGPEVLDSNPTTMARIKKDYRITEDYFTAIAPDPTPYQLDQIRASLAKLAQ